MELLGIVLGVVGVAATVVLGWLALPRRRELTWSYTATSLLAQDRAADKLDITVDGKRVRQPYVTRLEIKNSGKQSLASSSFDKDRGLVFEIDDADPVQPLADMEGFQPQTAYEERTIRIGPDMLDPGNRWLVSFVSDGKPHLRLSKSYLPGFTIQDPATTWRKERRQLLLRQGGILTGAVAFGCILILIFGFPFPWQSRPVEGPLAGVTCATFLQENDFQRWRDEDRTVRLTELETVNNAAARENALRRDLQVEKIDGYVVNVCKANPSDSVLSVLRSVQFTDVELNG